MPDRRSERIHRVSSVFLELRNRLAQHPFGGGGGGAAFAGESGAVRWKQKLSTQLQALAISLQAESLSEVARRAEELRQRVESAIDLEKPLDVSIRILDGDDTLRQAREDRRESFARAIEDARGVLELLENETRRCAHEAAQQELVAQSQAQAAREERERAAAAERERVAAQYSEFQSVAEATLARGCAAVVSGLYFVSPDGLARSLAMSIILVPAGMAVGGHQGPSILSFNGLRAYRGIVPPERVRELLASVRKGAVPRECLPGVDTAIELTANHWPSNREYVEGDRAPELSQGFAGNVFTVSGRSMAEVLPIDVWNRLATRLPAQNPPFGSTSHLCGALDLTSGFDVGATNVYCEVYSPSWVRLRSTELDFSAAQVTVEVESFWPDIELDTTLTLIPLAPRSTSSPPVPISKATWGHEEPADPSSAHVFKRTLSLPGNVGPVIVSLNFQGRQVDRHVVGNVSTRLVAHDSVDPDFKSLRELLFAVDKDKLEFFEGAICVLLHLCGLSAAPYGLKGMERSPDVIAFLGEGFAIFGECTVEPPDAKKIKNLTSRAAAFRGQLHQHGRDVRLVRTLFVRRPRRSMTTDAIEGALGENVTIAFQEDIEALLAMALQGESASKAASFLATVGNTVGAIVL